MANPKGGNINVGAAVQTLVNEPPASGTNNMFVTHKTNIADAFGKQFGDTKEGETLIFKPNTAGPPMLIGRIKANEWGAGKP
jgi:hypothetical protein